ncbi:MAG TPA: extracellular solute-binding protein [Burkholderiales bacterium]|nr:extracellular solute-binding protein [Burkholderiales bacterium]
MRFVSFRSLTAPCAVAAFLSLAPHLARAAATPAPGAPTATASPAAKGAPPAAGAGAGVYSGHGIAMHGDLKYPAGFKHFDYVNPSAPKGGEVKQSTVGTFDSFNPFIVRGNPAAGIARIYDTLLSPSADEPFSEYGLLAEKVETPADRSWVAFTLRPEARWHDGKPITVEDVIWSFETLRAKGQPFYRAYYDGVAKVEKTGDRTVKFTFKPGQNRELPLILGQLVVLPKHWWEKREFDSTSLDPPLGSAAYKIDSFDAGRRIVYRRVPDYWGKDLAVNVGRDNFDAIVVDYYRDDTVELEAFKAGEYDLRPETSAKNWATAYDFPAIQQGLVKKEQFPHSRPAGMQGFAFNTRRAQFQDARVREALDWAFDFEWSNKTLFYDQYKRTRSYFDNSELAATGLPSDAEKAVLEPWRGKIPDEVFTAEYQPPKTDGSGNNRDNLKRAVDLLKAAGWQIDPQTRKLKNAAGQPLEFEILLVNPSFERVVLPYAKNLERLGITANVRTVDSAQYRRRLDDFDFDVIVASFPESMSPGNEQRSFWGSAFADKPGSDNVIGIKSPAIDALAEAIIAAPDRKSLVDRTRALDRVLQWSHWVVPNWHIPYDRVAYWDKFGRPDKVPDQGVQIDTWWVDADKAAKLRERKGAPPAKRS